MLLLGFFSNLFEGPSGIVILLLALLLFGAKRIPELARSLGSAIQEFNKAKNDVQRQISQTTEIPAQPAPPPVIPAASTPQETHVSPAPPAQELPPKV